MSEAEILEALGELVRTRLQLEALGEGPLDEHLDSMQRLTLVVAVEDHFDICFEPEDDEEARTAADVVRIVKRHLDGRDG